MSPKANQLHRATRLRGSRLRGGGVQPCTRKSASCEPRAAHADERHAHLRARGVEHRPRARPHAEVVRPLAAQRHEAVDLLAAA